jgi:hypothetical protein
VIVGDELRIYYAGSGGTHGSGINRRSSFLLATLPRDRFAGLAAEGEGEIVTSELECGGPHIFLNAEATRGSILAEIQNLDGSPVRGFEMQWCERITRDSIRARLAWNNQANPESLAGRTIRLRLVLQNATLYAIDAN